MTKIMENDYISGMKKTITFLLVAIGIMSCGNNNTSWQEIAPTEIELNPVQMIDKDWLEVSAGKDGNMNLMTISWGSIGELWGSRFSLCMYPQAAIRTSSWRKMTTLL